jgi:hypothetical protein
MVKLMVPDSRSPRFTITVRYCHKLCVLGGERSYMGTDMWTMDQDDDSCWGNWDDQSRVVYVEPFECVCILFDLHDDGTIPLAVQDAVNRHFYGVRVQDDDADLDSHKYQPIGQLSVALFAMTTRA